MYAKKEKIKNLLSSDARFSVGAMIWMHDNLQTEEERTVEGTIEKNYEGFNGTDGRILTSYIKFFRRLGYLSSRQLDVIFKSMPKYHRQIEPLIYWTNNGFRNSPITIFQQYPVYTKEEIKAKKEQEEQVKKEESKEFSIPNPKKVTMKGKLAEIRFPYDPIIVAQVKQLDGRRYKGEGRYWTCPVSVTNLQNLIEFGFELDGDLSFWLKKEGEKYSKPTEKISNIPGMKIKPYPYQLEGIEFLESRGGRGLIGDEMGLGKTMQALGYLQLHPEARPAVIITPALAKLNWGREIMKTTTGIDFQILSGEKATKIDKDMVLINYDILSEKNRKNGNGSGKSWEDALVDLNPKIVIMDEVHRISNPKAKRSKAVKRICKRAKHTIALSGTPIKDKPKKFYNIINTLDPNLFPNFMKFGMRYCNGKSTPWGMDFEGHSNEGELNKILTSTIMIRRKKEDVLTDLPPKVRSVIAIPTTDPKPYKQAMKEFDIWMEGTYRSKRVREDGSVYYVNMPNSENPAAKMVEMEKIKHAAAQGKMESVFEWIENFLESDEKLIVFASHTDIVDSIQKKFEKIAVKISGGTSDKKRMEAMNKFQDDPNTKLFVGNIQAAGEAITLTSASNVTFVEFPWSPSDDDQASDRAHRIGQKNSVTVYYLIAEGTIEEDVVEILDEKRKTVSKILDGKEAKEIDLVKSLFNKIKAREAK